ncbi:hypothetical protein KUTG_09949 [Kutzneria sp. 744]|nr:hypothetical protein KUTG_09949 [Kutzneria sp. 744]
MGTAHQRRQRHEIGAVTFRPAILLGIGDDDTVEAVAEDEFDNEQAARTWVEQHLPHATFPEWVARRRHGTAGAFLFGQVQRGYYSGESDEDWELDHDAPSWDADLVDGVVRWHAGV